MEDMVPFKICHRTKREETKKASNRTTRATKPIQGIWECCLFTFIILTYFMGGFNLSNNILTSLWEGGGQVSNLGPQVLLQISFALFAVFFFCQKQKMY